MKRFLLCFICILLILSGCGKKEPPTEPTQPPREVDMIFVPVEEEVTAKEETNLRDYPSQGEDSAILYKLQNGEIAQRTGISDTGWSELVYDGKVCYAVSSFLTTDLDYTIPAETTAPTEPVQPDGMNSTFTAVQEKVTARDLVNLRSIPSVTSEECEILGQLEKGEVLMRIGVSDTGWSKLIYGDWVVYAVSKYLTLDGQGTGELLPMDEGIQTRFYVCEDTVTPKIEVNLRSKPSVTDVDARVVTTLKHGTPIQRTGINDDVGWSRVEYEGQILFCVSRYLEAYK